ncbi:hypothetical protein MycrhN_1284 [Mycolicibacterium rhodesiae NBB3]|uniref:O-antigen ligase-related domain-containing protein n=1 Tax=Mycolicibacterium rhodesiae (strain NBB3) TaxID=710685 RepID=G8RX48_MYCRN|nr:O-antigen ligase family protein [Mycolicibacterium rhodesiae]AEV71905.1 hypothetical protein MycrhN_1284 [Mycolicibacterium rhodesiae NBB3]
MQQRGRLFITTDTAAVLLVVVMWVRAVGSLIALSLTADKKFVPVGQEPIWTPAASLTSRGLYVLVIGICLGIILFRMNELTRPGLWRVVAVLAPWFCILLRDLYSGSPTPDSVLYVMVVLALAALRPDPRRILVTLGSLVLLTAVIALALGLLLPGAGVLHDSKGSAFQRSDKTVFPSLGLLQGMFTSENNLGTYISIGSAAVATLRPWWLRLSGLGIIVFAVLWSSSRSSMFALACMLVVGIVVWAIGEFGRRPAAAVARVAAFAAILTMCALPLMGWGDDAFTDRGFIWDRALAEWSSRAYLFGLGHDWFQHVAESDTSPLSVGAYQGHNQFVQFLVTGGVVFALFAVGSLLAQTYVITAPESRYLTIAAMLVTGICISGLLEVPLGFVDRSVFWTVTVVPLTVLFFARSGDTHREGGAR